jgi:hypothetical protein
MKHHNTYTRREGENMQRRNPGKAMHYLVVVCALVSALAMVGCGGGGGDEGGGATVTSGETISSVNTGSVPVSSNSVQALVGQPFAFQNGGVFDPSLAGTQTTLTFTSSNQASVAASGGSTSTAGVGFGSCTFTFTQGPLAGKPPVKFDPCTINITSGAVTAGGGAVSGTLTLTLSGPFGTGTTAITVQISILADGTLLVNGVSTGIIISSTGSPTTTGTTGTGGTP